MQHLNKLKPALLLVMAMALMPLLMPAGASAQATTIYAELGRCRTNVDLYQVQLQAGDQSARDSVFPSSVTLHFADGSEANVPAASSASFGTKYYRLTETRDVAVTGATAQWDTTAYPNYRFTVSARPCVPEPEPTPTYSVTGNVTQRGNEKPVADLTVCLVELNTCTTTDASGSFSFTRVEDGTYTLTTDGSNWKPQTNMVTVAGSDVFMNIVQFKGGGK